MTRPVPPTGLPVEHHLDELREALRTRGTAVLRAEPGAGKTTVVPLRLLESGDVDGRLVVLQPRRVAARSTAARMAQLVGERVGDTVGYRTRDDRRVGPDTRIEVVTEGILTRRLQHDPSLPGTGLLVVDEFHERNLQADLGLALALEARAALRPDLRILVMSATLDTARVAELLGGDGPPAPVIESGGRTHPVDVVWMPRRQRDRLEPAVAAAIRRALAQHHGDVLVFLPGVGEIRRTAGLLEGLDADVHELHGSLPVDRQDAALTPSPGRRKVVLSTDLAETSLTVEGIGVVVDAGLRRAPVHDVGTGMTRLTTVSASRASADQRAGRAGRLGPGTVIRLWSKMEHGTRRPHDEPEILTADLSGLALELAVWGTSDPAALPLLDVPSSRAWSEARDLLVRLGALDADGNPTADGRRMADLPLHPRLARMLVATEATGWAWTACVVAALLDDRDVLRGRPDELPADLTVRVELVADEGRGHPAADRGAVRRARRRAEDLARRLGVSPTRVDRSAVGLVLAHAHPDRIGLARGRTPGRYLLRSGSGAWVDEHDPLAASPMVVAADTDGRRKDSRIRLGAPVDEELVTALFGDEVEERRRLVWDTDRNDLRERTERRLGALRLRTSDERASTGPETVAALLDRVRATRLGVLDVEAAEGFRRRIAFCRHHRGDDWPDLSDAALLDTLDRWLEPFLSGVVDRAGLAGVDVTLALSTLLDWDRGQELDRLAPTHLTVPSGRRVPVRYEEGRAEIEVRVQEMFGSTDTPTVLGGDLPVTLHLLSPARRPVQVTDDLAGFWAGSYAEVRKEMAGRYPKHPWPDDPASATPR